ncbi:two-component sensor histidine kinase [Alishewanella agri BL06]|uniref:Two-component sensor histidine kinase n=1 Tax=Alishewanella agri BL06 TaxID=1195246 RepID=I9DPK1_9ALTE|nr:GGDEF domain-containing phosphodiesterase [Alishewanella agri]EIW87935.1 two-component sensor histidine kinase [Alishewanella agri BL06]
MIAQLLKTNLYSIRVRLSLILFAVFVLLALIAVIAIINEQQRQALHSSEQELRTIGSLSQASFNRALRLEMPEVMEELKTELQAHRRIQRVLRVSEQGQVLGAYNNRYLGQHASTVINHFNAELFTSTATSGLLAFQFIPGQQIFVLYLPLLAPGEDYSRPARQMLLLEYRHESSWLTALLSRWQALLIALIILSGTSALLWRYLQRTLADPVAQLVRALAEVSTGKSLQLPPGERRSEIGQLTQAIESMVRQRQADEAELRKLSAAVEQSKDGILITNQQQQIVYVNASLLELTGYGRAELIGQNPGMLGSGKTPDTVYQQMWQALNQDQAWTGEFINRRKDGSEYTELQTITPLKDRHGQISHYLSIKRDISEQKAAQLRLSFLAFYDVLTHLPNRMSLLEHLRQQDTGVSLVFLNIDRMKFINDARGFEYGNQVLLGMAKHLQRYKALYLSHLGADNFCLVLPPAAFPKLADAERLAGTLLAELQNPLSIDGELLVLSISIGISQATELIPPEQLIQQADTAMHVAKNLGGNRYACYRQTDSQSALQAFQIEKALRQALEKDELKLYLQSQCDQHGVLAGAEALVRWQHPEQGLISPALFIPVAERSDLIIALDNWVLAKAGELLANWRSQGLSYTLSVNISPRHVRHASFVEDVKAVLARYQFVPSALVLEVTEGLLVDDLEGSIAKMLQLTALGITFAIDDFGTGYSSLSYIRNLPVQELKIDQSFIKGIPNQQNDVVMVETIIAVARQLHLRVVAEGVETADQAVFCQQQGLWSQGYYIDKPLPIADWQTRWLNLLSSPARQ